jgi:hypothetical protein
LLASSQAGGVSGAIINNGVVPKGAAIKKQVDIGVFAGTITVRFLLTAF